MMTVDSFSFQPSFLSQLNHELRIPLTGILGMADLLEKTSLTVEQEKYLQVIKLSGERLLSLARKLDEMREKKIPAEITLTLDVNSTIQELSNLLLFKQGSKNAEPSN